MATPISFLAGVWRGSGHGEFPTMEDFDYEEEVSFIDLGLPSLVYRQRAWSPADGEVLHIEAGIWRASPEGELIISVALPRVTEISEGRIADGVIRLATTAVARAASGAGLVAVQRTYEVLDDRIEYDIAMATLTVPDITHHLTGALTRAEAGSPSRG